MKSSIRRISCTRVSALALFVAAGVGSTAALAEEAGQPAASDAASNGEIVVTAQKRTERLQTTAISADVLTGSALEAKRIDTVQALQLSTPSLSIGEGGITSGPNIRGIGLGVSSPQVVSGVATYRDGLFQPPILASEPFFDMARVEVLRGPQGTFVGSSSTGGAIFFVSNDPAFDKTGGYIRAGYGNYDDVQVQGAVNFPISETFAARVAFNAESRDSFFEQTGDVRIGNSGVAYKQPGNLDQRNLRVSFKWQPIPELTIVAKTALNRNNTDGLAHVLSPASPYYDGRAPKYELTYNVNDTVYNEKAFRQSLQMDYEFSNGITLRSLSGYNDLRVKYVDDFDSSSSPGSLTLPPATGTFSNQVHEYIASQEFNLISPKGNKLDWVLGAFYFYDYALASIIIQQPTPPTEIRPNSPNVKQALAGFGQIGYQLSPSLQVQAGLRYTQSYSDSSGTLTLIGLAPVPIVVPQTASERDDSWTGKVTLNWTISPDHFAYAFAAKGYKAGGINGPGSPNFAPETVYDYEFGLKSSWFDRHLRTQFNGFYMDYKNLQLTSYIPPVGGIGGGNGVTNAGGSKIYGFEFQAQGNFGPLSLDANISYVHSKLGGVTFINSNLLPGSGNVPLGPQCAPGVPNNPPTCFNYGPASSNLTGNRNPYSPQLTLNVGAQYRFDLGDETSITPRVDFTHISGQYQTIQNSNLSYSDLIEAHDLLNARITFDHGPWQVEVYGTNLTDSTYVTGYTYGPSLFLGRPRQYGVSMTRRF